MHCTLHANAKNRQKRLQNRPSTVKISLTRQFLTVNKEFNQLEERKVMPPRKAYGTILEPALSANQGFSAETGQTIMPSSGRT